MTKATFSLVLDGANDGPPITLGDLSAVPDAYDVGVLPDGRLAMQFVPPFDDLLLISGETVSLPVATRVMQAVAYFQRGAH